VVIGDFETMSAQLPESDVTNALSSLERLTDDELKRLINDEDNFDDFVRNLPQVQKWENDKEVLLASNKSLAEYNLSFEPTLTEGKLELTELYKKVRNLMDEVETKRAQLESLGSRTSLDTTHALLLTAHAESEEQTDGLSESFLNGSLDVESFLSQYVPLKQVSHLRKLKADKLAELIHSQRSREGNISSTPYPTTQMMPQPRLPM